MNINHYITSLINDCHYVCMYVLHCAFYGVEEINVIIRMMISLKLYFPKMMDLSYITRIYYMKINDMHATMALKQIYTRIGN